MAYNQELATRIENAPTLYPEGFTPKKMFGGIAFLYKGKMAIGAINNDLMVRIVSEKMQDLLKKPHVRPMNFTGRAMKEFIFVSEAGYVSEEQLFAFIELGLEHAKNKLGE